MLKKKQLQIKKLAALLIREIVNESIFFNSKFTQLQKYASTVKTNSMLKCLA